MKNLWKAIAARLKKNDASSRSIAAKHTELSKTYAAHAEFLKDQHEGMDDSDPLKTFMGKSVEFFSAQAEQHKSLGELYKAESRENDEVFNELDKAQDSSIEKREKPANTEVKEKSKKEEKGKEKEEEEDDDKYKSKKSTKKEDEEEDEDEADEEDDKKDKKKSVSSILEQTVDKLLAKALEKIDDDDTIQKRLSELVLERVNEELGNKIRPDGAKATLPDNIRPVGRGEVIKAEKIDPSLQDMVAVELD